MLGRSVAQSLLLICRKAQKAHNTSVPYREFSLHVSPITADCSIQYITSDECTADSLTFGTVIGK